MALKLRRAMYTAAVQVLRACACVFVDEKRDVLQK